MVEVSKSDWKKFRERIGGWQERHMERLNQSYIALLSSDKPASIKFWELERRIKTDKKSQGVVIQLRKSTFYWDIADMICDGVITEAEVADFSEECRERVALLLRPYRKK